MRQLLLQPTDPSKGGEGHCGQICDTRFDKKLVWLVRKVTTVSKEKMFNGS